MDKQETVMNETSETQLKEYLQNVSVLSADIENWSAKRGLDVKRATLEINEEEYGTYKIEKLILTDASRSIAEIIPIGCSIVGSYGRVDLVGLLDREVISYLKKDGPYITQSELIDGVLKEVRKKYFYRDINETGWYWIESTRLGRAKKFDEALFFDLLASVSDYERA
jgi:hypothetical protein